MELDELLKQNTFESHCIICGESMTIVKAIGFTLATFQNLQGCFECANCGSHTCYECSDRDRECTCGLSNWRQSSYVCPWDE